MNNTITFPFALPFALAAALVAAPTQAQDYLAPSKTKAKLEVKADAGLAWQVAFASISLSPQVLPFAGQLVLADGMVVLMPKDGDKFALDLDLPAAFEGGIYWQCATYDAAQGLRIRPVQKFDWAEGDVLVKQAPVDDAADQKPVLDDADVDADGDAHGALVEGEMLEVAGLQLWSEVGDDGQIELRARFEAPTDDYALRVLRAEVSDDGAGTDVYLYRKVPGPGEGLRDIVETHDASVALSRGRIRVFLAEGQTKEPEAALAFRMLAKFTL